MQKMVEGRNFTSYTLSESSETNVGGATPQNEALYKALVRKSVSQPPSVSQVPSFARSTNLKIN